LASQSPSGSGLGTCGGHSRSKEANDEVLPGSLRAASRDTSGQSPTDSRLSGGRATSTQSAENTIRPGKEDRTKGFDHPATIGSCYTPCSTLSFSRFWSGPKGTSTTESIWRREEGKPKASRGSCAIHGTYTGSGASFPSCIGDFRDAATARSQESSIDSAENKSLSNAFERCPRLRGRGTKQFGISGPTALPSCAGAEDLGPR
jgi:hypothetical protein